MPELPEVETVRKGLTRLVEGATIKTVDVLYEKMVSPRSSTFQQQLAGKKIERIDRRGKYLLFRFNDKLTMVSHLRMEGKYDVQPTGTPLTKHTHVVFHLTDGRDLRYTDTRKFGRMQLLETGTETQLVPGLTKMGPEPTEDTLTFDYMKQIFAKSKKAIKPLLLDQNEIAGLGNIYVDETLWMSRIHPLQPANSIPDYQIRQLRSNIIKEINRAIEGHGTTVHSFSTAFGEAGEFQNHLNVYGRKGEPCVRCDTPIEKIKVAQRGTHFCPACQVLRSKPSQTMVLGLTGGIATGKSTVSQLLQDYQIPIIDADKVAREVVEPGTDGLKQIQSTFGWQMIQPDGTLDRHALGTLVFAQHDKLDQLNQIMGPLIKAAVSAKLKRLRRQHQPLIIYDAPTLFEAHGAAGVSAIMVVSVPEDVQLKRLMTRDKLSQSEALNRIASQMPLADKIARADVVIDNAGSVDKTKAQVVKWLNEAGFSSLMSED
ncbi:formamidopyrimidine 5-formyluracil 5-hydroxymethyluracil DNA glycosylase [Secundilactobacillus odoratitofui DSM 19909 = JCM 15043]|uniref:Multifunctional fusion protein n=2 Tax=Secundilactobacillus odoratitofui TaxID=480930 RepID=A0A0R1LZK7_9LACO|nr:formamidopyrimidine 5-formyluracil 5-hydroxymethyluracil DNA glycosylase [Secundilactobacillus odoratitofui DSM 19909 = JCM 15043]